MLKDLKVSVIIAAFNEERNIGACLKTILDQSYQNTEVIVVDDGSTDQTIKIVEQFPIKLFRLSHRGAAKTRNYAADKASGDLLVFVDADMTFSRNFIRELVQPILAGKYKGTFSKEEYISNWDNIWSRCWNFNQNWPKQKMIPGDYPEEGFDFRAILKEEFIRVSGFDDVGYTDTWTLFKKLGYKPHVAKGAKYFHTNPDNLTEVFIQAKWTSKREYKLGFIGKIVALTRASLPISLIAGLYKAIQYQEPRFLVFKTIYDLGIFIGIIEFLATGKTSK